MALIPRKLCQVVGLACGFALIDYGFNFIAIGLPGAREMTSQFIGANMLIGGSAVIFISLFFLLRPAQPSVQKPQAERGAAPEIGVETVVEQRALFKAQSGMPLSVTNAQVDHVAPVAEPTAQVPEVLDLQLEQFSRSSSGEYEHRLADQVYDMVTVRPEMVNVWRESRTGMRSVYLVGPYELSSEFLEEHAETGRPIRIGILSLSGESIQTLLSMQKELQTQVPS